MGSVPGKSNGNYEEMALEKYGCDLEGTVLCPENETSMTCLNGGVCALYLKDLEDACEQRCRCPSDYIGKYCHLYNGFLSATVGIMVGILLAIIIIVFIVIIAWYCCNKKRNQRNTEAKDQNEEGQDLESGHYSRVPLSNRMEKQLKAQSLKYRARNDDPGLLQDENGHSTLQYPVQNVARATHIPKSFTSRSYSTYDNVNLDTEDELYNAYGNDVDVTVEPTDASCATTHLLSSDLADYGTQLIGPRDDSSLEVRMEASNPVVSPEPN